MGHQVAEGAGFMGFFRRMVIALFPGLALLIAVF